MPPVLSRAGVCRRKMVRNFECKCECIEDTHRRSHRCSQADLCLSVNIVNGNPFLDEKEIYKSIEKE